MPRALRPLPILSALSLLLCAAAVVLWVRSYSGSDYVSRNKALSSDPTTIRSRGQQVRWTRGTIRLETSDLTYYPHGHPVPPAPADPPAHWGYGRLGAGHLGWDAPPEQSIWNRLGFHVYEGGSGASFYDERISGISFPAWLPVAAFAAPPLLLAFRLTRRRLRKSAGLCRRCGYDVRASRESGRCPECGEALPAAAGRRVT